MSELSLVHEITKLKQERNAVILAHNYQRPEVQDIADFVGDSLGLSMQAAGTDADVIVFCGVYFMAETAKILSPGKTVLIPDSNAGCPLAQMITVDDVRVLKQRHPEARTLCYVNTTAAVKAECDLCCTSANAVAVIESLPQDDRPLIFVPDKYLAGYAARQTGREIIAGGGYCPSHVKILAEDILRLKAAHPRARVVVHPECTPEVQALADTIASTEGMCRDVKRSDAAEFIIGTEAGMVYRLRKENPGKTFFPASGLALCPNMKRCTVEKVRGALANNQYEVDVPEHIIEKARKSLAYMMSLTAPAGGVRLAAVTSPVNLSSPGI